ncbi:MAG: 4Fe-4S binding protein [Anaerovoracaceae bacterium]
MAKVSLKKNKIRRAWVQSGFTVLTNSHASGFLQGKIYTGPAKAVCVPGLNCYSCPGALGSCPVGSLQAVLGSREFSMSFYVLGFLAAAGALVGRLVCGWLCPFGLVQDILHKIPFVRKYTKMRADRVLRWLKYAILAVFVIALPVWISDVTGMGDPWYCKYICPSGTLMAGWPLLAANASLRRAAGALFAWKSAILIAVLLLSISIYRPFCRWACPLGAIYGLMNRASFYRLELDRDTCIDCGRCEAACKLGIPVLTDQNSADCIRCGDCTNACPTGALHSSLDALLAQKRPDTSHGQTHKSQSSD